MRRILPFILILLVPAAAWGLIVGYAGVGGGGAPPPSYVTDDFNRTDENPLSGSGNWSSVSGNDDLRIVSNEVTAQDNTTAVMIYTGTTFNSNQYSEIKAITVTGYNWTIGTVVRGKTSGEYYRVRATGAAYTHIEKWDGAEASYSSQYEYTPQVNDVIGIQASGDAVSTTIKVYINSPDNVIITWVDTSSPLTGGYPGITMQDYGQRADDWEGGNL